MYDGDNGHCGNQCGFGVDAFHRANAAIGVFSPWRELFTRSRAVRIAPCDPHFRALMDPAHIASELISSDFKACLIEDFQH